MANPELSELLRNLKNICNLVSKHPNFGRYVDGFIADKIEDILFDIDYEIEYAEKQEAKACSTSSPTV